jgi:signal transduction histidine kinase
LVTTNTYFSAASCKNNETDGGDDLPDGVTLKSGPTTRNTGSGMSAETLEHAFEAFFTTKAEGMGTGLGLSTVAGFANQSGGTVRINSEIGRGTSVTIYLPRATTGCPN